MNKQYLHRSDGVEKGLPQRMRSNPSEIVPHPPGSVRAGPPSRRGVTVLADTSWEIYQTPF